jgi:outer membrane protein assembly factor BamB
VLAFSTSDGRELWRAVVGSEVLSVPRITDTGQVIVHTLDDSVAALDASTGAELWRVTYPAPVLTLRGSSSPVVTGDAVLIGLSGGKLVKLDLDEGAPIWETVITRPSGRSELARIADIDADPVIIGTIAFVGSYNGDLAAVDIASGTILWRRELSAHAGLAADTANLFITDSIDQIWGADPSDGAGRWRQEGLKHRQVTAPALVGDLLVVGDLDGYVHVLSRTDGQIVGRTRIKGKGAISARPIASGGRVFVSTDEGVLTALRIGGASPSAAPGRGGAVRAAGSPTAVSPAANGQSGSVRNAP